MDDPGGGIRWVIPRRAEYWASLEASRTPSEVAGFLECTSSLSDRLGRAAPAGRRRTDLPSRGSRLRPMGAQAAWEDGERARLVKVALVLVVVSVCWGAASGALAIGPGVIDHSLSVLGVGLGVLADLAGSAILVLALPGRTARSRQQRKSEEKAALVVALALALAGAVLAAAAVHALIVQSHPGASLYTLATAAAALVVLTPLAVSKRRVGSALQSRALKGDGTLSGVGAGTALLALVSLLLYRELGVGGQTEPRRYSSPSWRRSRPTGPSGGSRLGACGTRGGSRPRALGQDLDVPTRAGC